MLSFVWLIVGFVMLVWGADRFVDGSSSLAKKMGVPSLIIGLTVVAFGTSAPELAVSVTAGFNGSNEIALGNVIGSNFFNLLVVGGMSAIITPLVVEKDLIKRDWPATIIATVALFILLVIDRDISRIDALILLAGFALIMYLQVSSARKSKITVDEDVKIDKPIKIALNIIIGLACIVAGGQLSVSGATEIATMFGLSETIIGLTVVALGTSLPELVTSLVATKRGEKSIAIGNVIGSSLFNILLILGVSCLINPIPVETTAVYDTLILVIVTALMFVLAKMDKLKRLSGVFLTLSYVVYTVWIIIR